MPSRGKKESVDSAEMQGNGHENGGGSGMEVNFRLMDTPEGYGSMDKGVVNDEHVHSFRDHGYMQQWKRSNDAGKNQWAHD